MSCAKAAVPVKMQFGMMSWVGVHWRRLANTIESSVCGGDMALCQITLATCFELLYGMAQKIRAFATASRKRCQRLHRVI